MNCVSEQFEVTAHEKLSTKDAHFCLVSMESCGGTYLVLVVLRILLTVPVQNYQSSVKVCMQKVKLSRLTELQ